MKEKNEIKRQNIQTSYNFYLYFNFFLFFSSLSSASPCHLLPCISLSPSPTPITCLIPYSPCHLLPPQNPDGGVSWAIPNGGGSQHTNTTGSSSSSAPNNPTSTSVFGPTNVNGSVFGSPPGGVFGGGVNGGAPVMGTPPTAPSPWQAFSGANPFSGMLLKVMRYYDWIN